MGATLTTGWLNGSKLSIAHVGDSRAYLLRTGVLQQLTNDHSLVAEQVRRGILTPQQAEESEMQSVLLRALGAHPEVDVEVDEVDSLSRDVLLFCSDGLTRMVSEPEIAGTLQAETDPDRQPQRLVDLANERGGLDNVTAVLWCGWQDDSKGWFSWLRARPRNKTENNGSAREGSLMAKLSLMFENNVVKEVPIGNRPGIDRALTGQRHSDR